MKVSLVKSERILDNVTLEISGSKSETNRLLILQAQYSGISLINASDSDDSHILRKALQQLENSQKTEINIGHAGTAMRFLTAYCAVKDGLDVILKGSERMNNRPIGALVDALREMGVNITYLNKEGFPPLHIKGTKIIKNKISIFAQQSSQFITALLLIAPSLEKGLEIELINSAASESYIELSLSILRQLGIEVKRNKNQIVVSPKQKLSPTTYTIESDWSSLSYYYSLLALLPAGKISFKYYSEKSFQGDSVLKDIYSTLGVLTEFDVSRQLVTLTKVPVTLPETVRLDLIRTPDIAQTIAVTCFGLRIGCVLEGLHTLKFKETNRLFALKTELEKLGAKAIISDSIFKLEAAGEINSDIAIDTYQDHRMALAFAPLVAKTNLIINDANVVSKSYPNFWKHFQMLGISSDILA